MYLQMNPIATSHRLEPGAAGTGAARYITVALALCALVLGVSACSSSPSGTTTTTPAATTSTGAGSVTTTSKPASSDASFAQFGSKLEAGQSATFLADYSVNGEANGSPITGTMKVAHTGSTGVFAISTPKGAFEDIEAGAKDTYCGMESGAKWTCFTGSLGALVAKALLAFTNIFSQKAAFAAVQADEHGAYDVSRSTTSVAGQSASCLTFRTHVDAGTYTYCATSQGVLAQLNGQNASGHWTLKLTSISSNVPSGDLTPPGPVTTIP
jgi:hypothetical protein